MWDALAGADAGFAEPPRTHAYRSAVTARLTANNRHLVVADYRQGVSVWGLDGRHVRDLYPRGERYWRHRGVCVAPDGRVLVADPDDPLTAFDPETWAATPLWAPAGTQLGRALACDPSGERVAVGSGEVIDLATGRQVGRWKPEGGHPEQLAWAGGPVAVAEYGPTVHVHDPATGRELAALTPGLKHTNAVAFTPDGRSLLTGGTEGFIREYAADGWAERRVFHFEAGPVHALAVSPGGLRAAAGCGTSQRGKVVVWDLD